MFSGIVIYVVAAMAAIVVVFFIIVKYQSSKIERLEHENKTIHKKSEIQTSQAVFKAQVLADEQDELLKEMKSDKKITLDDINRL